MKKINNKGFTLMELVVAIAVLTIALVPILDSFITSARLNVKSRKLMAATNIQQSIMEGFADKTYTEVLSLCSNNGSGLTGKRIFSTVSSNALNDQSSWKTDPDIYKTTLGTRAGALNSASKISWAGSTTVSSNAINISGSTSEAVYGAMLEDIQSAFGQVMLTDKESCSTPAVGWWTDNNKVLLAMYFENISEGAFTFDAIAVFVPAAATDDDIYYPYYVNIYLYSDAEEVDDYHAPFMTYTSGIKNVYQKGSTEK